MTKKNSKEWHDWLRRDDPIFQKLRLDLHKLFEGEPDTQREITRIVDAFQKEPYKGTNDEPRM